MAALSLARPGHGQSRLGQVNSGLPLVGVMFPRAEDEVAKERLTHIRKGMQDIGLVEGIHYSLAIRYANGDLSRWPSLAQELGALNPRVIIVLGYGASVLHNVLPRMPVVFTGIASDPIKAGYVKSYAQPGGLITGNVTNALGGEETVTQKRIGLFKQIIPDLTRLAMIGPEAGYVAAIEKEALQKVAAQLGFEFVNLGIRTLDDMKGAIAAGLREKVSAFYISGDTLMFTDFPRVIRIVQASRRPSVGPYPEWGRGGLLMSYSTDLADGVRRAGVYAAKILNGAAPGDLPIEQASKFVMVINQQTAKALGIVIPPTVLALADEVVE